MNNNKPNTFDSLDSLLIKKDKSNVAESVKPFKLKPMGSFNGTKSFQPKRSIVKKIKKQD